MRAQPTRSNIPLLLPAALALLIGGTTGAAEGNRCDRVVGNWGWFIGGTVTFATGARVRWVPAVSTIPAAEGTWRCAPDSGTYTVTWQNGFIDTLQLSADGNRLDGTSSTGVQVSGRRTSAAAPAMPATGTTSATVPGTVRQKAPEGWTPLGPGGFGRQSPVPMGPGGIPQRIGPQGRPPPKGAG